MNIKVAAQYSTEPLSTLATYRKRGNKVVFGRNYNHAGKGMIRVGAPYDVYSWAQ